MDHISSHRQSSNSNCNETHAAFSPNGVEWRRTRETNETIQTYYGSPSFGFDNKRFLFSRFCKIR